MNWNCNIWSDGQRSLLGDTSFICCLPSHHHWTQIKYVSRSFVKNPAFLVLKAGVITNLICYIWSHVQGFLLEDTISGFSSGSCKPLLYPTFLCFRKEMAQPYSTGPQAFRRGGWAPEGDPHARAPQLQVQTSETEAQQARRVYRSESTPCAAAHPLHGVRRPLHTRGSAHPWQLTHRQPRPRDGLHPRPARGPQQPRLQPAHAGDVPHGTG